MLQGMNPKLMKQAMKKMGVKETSINASEVIIKTDEGNLVIRNPQVSKVVMMGQESFQIVGEAELESEISEEDIKTVMEQTDCGEDEARKALEEADGDIAKAILDLQS
ncbi:MAG: nascent polypeptide-associated complex protein [archaeon]